MIRMGEKYTGDDGSLTRQGYSALKVVDDLQAVEAENVINAPGDAPRFFPRAWVSFAGATGAIGDSGNVASVTRAGTGEYTVTFTTDAPNLNYVPLISAAENTVFLRFRSRAVGSCVIEARGSAGALTDPLVVAVAFIW